MFIFRLFLLVNLIVSFCMFSMEVVHHENHSTYMPAELLPSFLIREHDKHPWSNFIHACKLGLVCKSWQAVVSKHDTLRNYFNIPLMHYWSMVGNADKIIERKFAGDSPLAPDVRGLRPMHYAIGCGQHNAMKMLAIGLAISPDDSTFIRKDDEKTRQLFKEFSGTHFTVDDLTKAVENNSYEEVETILCKNPTFYRESQLELAQFFGFRRLINLLCYTQQSIMEHELFGTIEDQEDITEEFFKQFVARGANFNAYNLDGSTVLHQLARRPTLQATVKKLLELENININALDVSCYNVLKLCVATGNIECLRQLLEAKKLRNEIFLDADRDTLSLAIHNNRTNCAELLIEYGIALNELDSSGIAPLHRAVFNNNRDVILAIINTPQRNLDIVSTDGLTPLLESVRYDRAECMSLLITHGADVNCITALGDNVIFMASSCGATGCLKRLLAMPSLKYQINSKTKDGYSPLISASRGNHIGCMELLIKAGAHVDLSDLQGRTALHVAARAGFCDAINVLIDNDAYVNCASKSHYTPLHFAAINGHVEAARILVARGAFTNLKTNEPSKEHGGKTALDLARHHNHPAIVALLEDI